MTLISILGTINSKNIDRYKKFSKSEVIDSIYQNQKGPVPNLKIFTSLKNIVFNFQHCIMSTYPNAHAKVDNWISENQFPEIGLSLVSFGMIFEALQSEAFRFKFRSLGSKIIKIPKFNLMMGLSFQLSQTTFIIFRTTAFS